MKSLMSVLVLGGVLGLAMLGRGSAAAAPQDTAKSNAKVVAKADSRDAINADYERERLEIERRRLERLARLAPTLSNEEAEATYALLFQLAMTNNLSVEAEPTAEALIKAGTASPQLLAFANLVNLFAEVHRGDYPASLASLTAALREGQAAVEGGKVAVPLPIAARVSLIDAYYQRLIQADQFDVARKAMTLVLQNGTNSVIKDLAARRLKQVNLVGHPAPAIVGEDLDKKPFRLADLKGGPVLIVFWASWCLPNGEEVERLEQVYSAFQERGFRIVGINLDAMQQGMPAESVMPNVHRFLLDHNVRWPNLMNGSGANNYAAAFGVSEVPANVLIGRDGTVIHFDLTRGNLASAVAKAVGR